MSSFACYVMLIFQNKHAEWANLNDKSSTSYKIVEERQELKSSNQTVITSAIKQQYMNFLQIAEYGNL